MTQKKLQKHQKNQLNINMDSKLKNYKRPARRYIEELKKNSSCLFCKLSIPVCLDFHHINEQDKLFNVGEGINNKRLEDMKAEVKKCIIVCANCHRIIHNLDSIKEDKKTWKYYSTILKSLNTIG